MEATRFLATINWPGAVVGIFVTGAIIVLVLWYIRKSRGRRELLERAIRNTNYSTYVGLSWTCLVIMSLIGRHLISAPPREPPGHARVVSCGLLALLVALIAMAVRERMKANRIVKRHLSVAQGATAACKGAGVS